MGSLNIKFRKIKFCKDGKIEIHYIELKDKQEPDEHIFISADQPKPSFKNAMLKLRKTALDLCEIPSDDEAVKSIAVTGISLSWSEENGYGITLTAQKKLKNSDQPLVLNTPHKLEDSETPNKIFPSSGFLEVMVVLEEAQAYLEGDREQMDMFREQAKEVA